MARKGELELVYLLRKHGLKCLHQLQQKRITDYMPKNHKSREKTEYWLEMNKKLPRKKHTFEVDVFSWKDNHWGALAIEQKSQRGHPKTLCVSDQLRLYSGRAELREGASELLWQCQGAGHLGRAFAAANNISGRVIPVGVIDYDIKVFNTPSKWAYHDGVFFVNSKYFPEFINQFLEKEGWVRGMASKSLT